MFDIVQPSVLMPCVVCCSFVLGVSLFSSNPAHCNVHLLHVGGVVREPVSAPLIFDCSRPRMVRRNLVDPASSHMLVSKIKPCMSQYKLLYGEIANGSLKHL